MINIAGFATSDGTIRYRDRNASATGDGHFRAFGDLWVSSIGMGTYLGNSDADDDARYEQAAMHALSLGINVLDTAINYRCQRSERNLGAALRTAIDAGSVQRDEVVVASKAGFLPFDGTRPANPRAYIRETFVDSGLVTRDEIAGGCHCMAPAYVEDQLSRSRANLGLETIDIYYLHNPEMQLSEIEHDVFMQRIRAAFEVLEQACTDGHIRCYGTATWDGYRVAPSADEHLSLGDMLAAAQDVGGRGHHLRVVQLPYNMAMKEAATSNTQAGVPLLRAAADAGVYVIGSASILQGRLAEPLPSAVADAIRGLDTSAQRALQFARSTEGVGTALVGMRSTAHIAENASVIAIPPAPAAAIDSLLA